MRVVFLDFDGVVNTLRWRKVNGEWDSYFGYPEDGGLNDESAVQWVSEFCEKYEYDVVVSSTWRKDGLENCEKYLREAGLRDSIRVIGVTPVLSKERGYEIKSWLDEHPDVTGFLIFDDDSDMVYDSYMDRLVRCRTMAGFTCDEFQDAVRIHEAFNAG